MKKTIKLISYSPLRYGESVGWDDMYLRFKMRRKTVKLAPCLISREHLVSDIKMHERFANESNKFVAEYQKDVANMQEMLRQVDSNGYAIDAKPDSVFKPNKDFVLANVYTKANWIDKKESERMITWYLGEFGLTNLNFRFDWIKEKFIVRGVTL